MKQFWFKFVVTVTANILTWIPSGVIYTAAMIAKEYPMDMILWALVAVEPINCIINPLLFIRTSIKIYKNNT